MSDKVTIRNESGQEWVVPADELGPDMMEVFDANIQKTVWMDKRHARWSKRRNDGSYWTEDFKQRTQAVKDALERVYPCTLDEWNEGFRTDMHPDLELFRWEAVAAAYKKHAYARVQFKNLEIFKILMACTFSNRKHAMHVMPENSFSRKKLRIIIQDYFDALEKLWKASGL